MVVVSFREGNEGSLPNTPVPLPCPACYYVLCSRYSTIRLGAYWCGGVVVYTHGGWGDGGMSELLRQRYTHGGGG